MADSSAKLPVVRIGTRQSILAKIQAESIRDALQKHFLDRAFEVDAMRTLGDCDRITALYSFEGKNLWTSKLEEKLTAGKVDVIVHCLKGTLSAPLFFYKRKPLTLIHQTCRRIFPRTVRQRLYKLSKS
ncbi:hypothetical protein MY11210_007397 [Beauveria gryllotalpidicola]